MPKNIYAPPDASKVPRFSDVATFLGGATFRIAVLWRW